MSRALIFAAAAVAAAAAPVAASAQSYGNDYYRNGPIPQECQQQLNNQRLTGALIGGVAGALLGRSVSAKQARTGGGAIGGIAGAVIGSEIARGRLTCDDAYARQGAYRPAPGYAQYDPRDDDYDDRRYQPSSGYGYGDRGYDDDRTWRTSAPRQYSNYGREICGWGTAELRDPDGYGRPQDVWMCRQPRGEWYVAER